MDICQEKYQFGFLKLSNFKSRQFFYKYCHTKSRLIVICVNGGVLLNDVVLNDVVLNGVVLNRVAEFTSISI